MSSVTSATANPTGTADLLKALGGSASSALSSVLSSSQLQSALKTATPGDIVALSQQAIQLQFTGGLLGGSDTTQTSTDPGSLLLQALNSAITGSTAPGTASAGSTTTAGQQLADFFGTSGSSRTNTDPGTLLLQQPVSLLG